MSTAKDDFLAALFAFYSDVHPTKDYDVFHCHRIPHVLEGERRLSETWPGLESLTAEDRGSTSARRCRLT